MKIFHKIAAWGGRAMLATMLAAQPAVAAELRFWTTEEQPDRLAKQEAMAADFKAKTGVDVRVIPVSEKDMETRAAAAFAAGDLPDVIYHPLQHVFPWAEAGLLDTDVNNEAVEELGASTFAPGALAMVRADGDYASVPVDGWTQMLVYRKDLFEANGLAPPRDYASILSAVKKLHNPPQMYGFVAATKVDEGFMSQVLEHVFLANGVSPVDRNGLRKLDKKRTAETLEFYKAIAKASPPGELYWKQSREMYFAGRAAMIIWSPFILDELAGLRDSAPPTINDDPTSRELAGKTGVVTSFSGPSNPGGAGWADIRFFSVTSDADIENAKAFVKFCMDEGYTRTLGIAPEGKFPVRRGDQGNPKKFIQAWSKLPVGVDRKAPLSELYPAEVIDDIVSGLESANRWGASEGQLALASKINNSRVFNRLVREFIDGERSANATVDKINEELARL